MKICITSQGETPGSEIDPRFGRCQYLIIVETETDNFEIIKNPSVDATGGAGIQTAQIVAEKNIEAVLTGNIGPNAFQVLQAANIKIYTGITGRVRDAIEKFKTGSLFQTERPTVKGKSASKIKESDRYARKKWSWTRR